MNLFAIENVTQLLAIQPCARGALAGVLRHQGVKIVALLSAQLAPIFEQRPTQTFQFGVGLLFNAPHLVDCGTGMGHHMKFIESHAGKRQVLVNALDEGW